MSSRDPRHVAHEHLRDSFSIGRGGTAGLATAMAMFGLVVVGGVPLLVHLAASRVFGHRGHS